MPFQYVLRRDRIEMSSSYGLTPQVSAGKLILIESPADQELIGGADGLKDDIRKRARFLLAFGPQTWPHMMVRVMLLEQLYRAQQIIAGHPYHRD